MKTTTTAKTMSKKALNALNKEFNLLAPAVDGGYANGATMARFAELSALLAADWNARYPDLAF